MFSFFQIGTLEIASVLVVCTIVGAIGLYRPAAWRLLAVIASVFMIAMICTPADPLSLWLVAVPTCAVFISGVLLSPYLRRPNANSSSN